MRGLFAYVLSLATAVAAPISSNSDDNTCEPDGITISEEGSSLI